MPRRSVNSSTSIRRPSSRRTAKIRVGVSSCLLGNKVRYDGAHSRNSFITGTLSRYFEWVSVCPEAEAGMGVPREPVNLVKKGGQLRMTGVSSGRDWTAVMKSFSRGRLKHLSRDGLCGYIFKKRSPSCGLTDVPHYSASGAAVASGAGLFADAFMKRFPLVPAEDEGRLQDPGLRKNFIVRVFGFHRLLRFFSGPWTRAGLARFHAREQKLLLFRSPAHERRLGKLAASARKKPSALRNEYMRLFMEALKKEPLQKKAPGRKKRAKSV